MPPLLHARDRLSRHPHRIGALFFFLGLLAALFAPRYPEPTPVWQTAHFASNQGNGGFLWAGIGLLLLLAVKDASRAWAGCIARVMLVETVLVHLVKLATGPWLPRPSGGAGGFPSGHSAAAFALAFLLSERFPRGAVVWYGIAAVIAWSRVAVNDHYAYQVVGGMALGLATALLLFDLSWRQRRKTG